jgi:Protein of unknown function (DUF2877)
MSTPFAEELLGGHTRTGTALGHGYVRFGDDVLAVTPPGAPRMPNGIVADLPLEAGDEVTAGGGELRTSTRSLRPSLTWDPRPHARLPRRKTPSRRLARLAGHGPGLTPLGDDILIGYIGAAALAGLDLSRLAEDAARHTSALSATLLRRAAAGELPEPAHALLENGDVEPLLRFGASSGKGIMLGIALYLEGEPCS